MSHFDVDTNINYYRFKILLKTKLMRKLFILFTLFTAGNIAAQSPGGYATNLYLWVKGSAGVTQSSGNVSVWTNQAATGMATQASKTANANVTLVANGINYNPVLRYTGVTSEMLSGKYAVTQTQPVLVFAVANGGSGTSILGNPYSNASEGSSGLIYDETTGKYWIDASGNECSSSSSFTNKTVIARASYAATANTLNSFTALNGIATASLCTSLPLSAMDGNFQIGGRTWGGNITRVFKGDLAEVIYYNGNTATATQVQQVESYLAVKYGITLGNTTTPVNYIASNGTTTFWTSNATYQNDVFGIGTDNGSGFSNTTSNSMNTGSGNGTGQSGLLNSVLSTGTALSNNQFLIAGNDAASLSEQTTNVPVSVTGSRRVGRTWKVQNTGSVGVVNLSFDITGLTYTGGVNPANYVLMINNNGTSNFTTGTQTYYYASSITGNLINFSGISLGNGVVYSLITQIVGVPLPLTWVRFIALREAQQVQLQWTTADETNLGHFSIEHSTDGINFSDKASKAANSNSSPIQTYTYNDKPEPATGLHYYRIKATDQSGKYTYSSVKVVKMEPTAELKIKSASLPNNLLQANIISPQRGLMEFVITNNVGQLVNRFSKVVDAGANSISENNVKLIQGIYILRCTIDARATTIKLFKYN